MKQKEFVDEEALEEEVTLKAYFRSNDASIGFRTHCFITNAFH